MPVDKNNNENVISLNKAATAVPQHARKKSRIFEDLPKLFESNVPEDLPSRASTTDPQTAPWELQEGLCDVLYLLNPSIGKCHERAVSKATNANVSSSLFSFAYL